MAKKRWISTNKARDKKYTYCPGKCGAHMFIEKAPVITICTVCGFETKIHQIEDGKVLIEVKQ